MAIDLLFIHSAGSQVQGEGSSKFLAWLTTQFGNKFNIIAPTMPHPENPDYEDWKLVLANLFATLSDRAVVVGHSLGGSSLLKYLTENAVKQDIQGLFVVAAPYWGADDNWTEEIFRFQDNEPAEIDKVEKMYIYHSRSDQVVPFQHQSCYSEKFPLAMAISVEGVDHVFPEPVEALIQDLETMEQG